MIRNYWLLTIFLLLVNLVKADPANYTKLINSTLNSRSDDCPKIVSTNISIVPASCNGSDGKILGISGTRTGTLTFTWYDADNNIVGTTADLTNMPAGRYKVRLQDESKCLPVEASYSISLKNQVVIDNSATIITSPDCNQNNGSITNITFTN